MTDKISDRALEILNEFTLWHPEREGSVCPIGAGPRHDPWLTKLANLCHRLSALEAELAAARATGLAWKAMDGKLPHYGEMVLLMYRVNYDPPEHIRFATGKPRTQAWYWDDGEPVRAHVTLLAWAALPDPAAVAAAVAEGRGA